MTDISNLGCLCEEHIHDNLEHVEKMLETESYRKLQIMEKKIGKEIYIHRGYSCEHHPETVKWVVEKGKLLDKNNHYKWTAIDWHYEGMHEETFKIAQDIKAKRDIEHYELVKILRSEFDRFGIGRGLIHTDTNDKPPFVWYYL